VFRIPEEDLEDAKKQYKLKDLAKNRPILRFYPNEIVDEAKGQASHAITFDPKSKELGGIYQTIHSSFESRVN